jgi:hypothetical protein
MPVTVKIDYANGYAVLGMPEAYTMMTLAREFAAITPQWRFLPIPCTKRDYQGWVIHEALAQRTPQDDFTNNDQILILPVCIQEEAAGGVEIGLKSDQLPVLDYWAQARQTAHVSISIGDRQRQIEYWTPIQLDPMAEEPPETYLAALNGQCPNVLAGMAPLTAQHLIGQEIEYVFKMRYLANTLRILFAPKVCPDARYRSLAEYAAPKDR